MNRVDAYHILHKMWKDADEKQKEAIEIAQNDIEFVDLMPDEYKKPKRGQWLMKDTAYCCSLCGQGMFHPWSNYCPNCGAKMTEVDSSVTNREWIHSMTDEELAEFIADPCSCKVDPEADGFRECGNYLCLDYLVRWLKQPHDEKCWKTIPVPYYLMND